METLGGYLGSLLLFDRNGSHGLVKAVLDPSISMSLGWREVSVESRKVIYEI